MSSSRLICNARKEESVVLVHIPSNATLNAAPGAEEGLFRYWNAIWEGKVLIAAVTAIFVALAVVYALTATPRYRATALLAPVEQDEMQGALLGQLSGLAGLAGINMGQQSSAEALAILKSRKFTREFISERNLLPVLYSEQWDLTRNTWQSQDPATHPDLKDAVEYFEESVRDVAENKLTGLVTITVDWKDPVQSAEWANALAKKLNATLRARALDEAERNIEYLRLQLQDTSNLSLQQGIANLIENQMQKLMMARGNVEFAYRIIDPAEAPKRRSWPMRTLIVLASAFVGGFVAMVFVLIRSELRSFRQRHESATLADSESAQGSGRAAKQA